MAADLPTAAAIQSGTVTNAQQKTNLGAIATFLLNLLGNDSSDKATARATLGVPTSIARNLLINGNFNINQRAYVSGVATTGANQYTLDRWRVVTSGQNLAFTASGNGNLVTAPAGGLEQVIEGSNIGLAAAVINWVGTATCTVDGVAKTKGAAVTLVPGTNCTVRFTGGTVSQAQLEYGTASTAFEFRLVQTELQMCQRYCEVIDIGFLSNSPTTSAVAGTGTFLVTKRAVPTPTRLGGGPGGFTAPDVLTPSVNGFYFSRAAFQAGGNYLFTAEL